jgi:AcrR family transcriptional regulator
MTDTASEAVTEALTTGEEQPDQRRRPRGAVREGLVAAGLELARTGGPDAVVLREATRKVGVVPNAAYRHFADRDELLAAVCTAAMGELADRMAEGVAAVPGEHGDPQAAVLRLGAIGRAYLAFARDEPGWFATAFALPQRHDYAAPSSKAPDDEAPGDDAPSHEAPGARSVAEAAGNHSPDRSPLGQLRAALDGLVDAGVLDPARREGAEYPVWSAVHGLAVLSGRGPMRGVPDEEKHRLEQLTLAFIARSLAGSRSSEGPDGARPGPGPGAAR